MFLGEIVIRKMLDTLISPVEGGRKRFRGSILEFSDVGDFGIEGSEGRLYR